jgi:hypothetical protein
MSPENPMPDSVIIAFRFVLVSGRAVVDRIGWRDHDLGDSKTVMGQL